MLLNYWTLVESNNIARERGITFHNFEKSDYANGTYFDKYTSGQFVPKSDRVKELFEGIFIPSAADWAELRDKVKADGLYHQNRLAVAPNGSISYINDVSASIHPITQRIEERQEKKIGKITILLQDYQLKLFLTTLLPMTWICVKLSMSMLLQLST